MLTLLNKIYDNVISNERNTLFFVLDSDGTTVLAAASCNETLEQKDVDRSSSSDSNSSSTSSNLDRAYISTISSRDFLLSSDETMLSTVLLLLKNVANPNATLGNVNGIREVG